MEAAYLWQRGPLRWRYILDSDHGEGLCIRVADASGPRRPTPSTRCTPHGAHSNRNPSEASSVFVCSKNGLPRAQKSVSAPQTLQAGRATSLLHDTPMVGAEQCRLYGKCGLSSPFPPSSSFTFLLSLSYFSARKSFFFFVLVCLS